MGRQRGDAWSEGVQTGIEDSNLGNVYGDRAAGALWLTGVGCSSWTMTDCWDCDELATVGVVGGFVLLLFPLPFAAMPFSSFSTTTSWAHLAAVLGLIGFGITAGIDNEVNLLRSSSLLWFFYLLFPTHFPHILFAFLPHAYYFLFTFLFPSTDFLFFHAQPYCLCIASCTVQLLMHSTAQSCTVCLLMHSLLRHSLVTQYMLWLQTIIESSTVKVKE